MLYCTISLLCVLMIFCDTVCYVQAPQPVEPWGDDVIHDALEFGPSCPQTIFESDNSLKPLREDCLYLNIYSPYRVSDELVLHHFEIICRSKRDSTEFMGYRLYIFPREKIFKNGTNP